MAEYNRFAERGKRRFTGPLKPRGCNPWALGAPAQPCYTTHIPTIPDSPAEPRVFTLVLILIVVGLVLGVSLFVGALFVQGYIYTEPSPHLRWGAPVAAVLLSLFYSAWALAVAYSAPSSDESLYHIIWQFSPTANQFPTPAKDLWAVRKGDKKEHYVLKNKVVFKGRARAEYRSVETDRPWNSAGVEAIIIQPSDGGPQVRYNPVPEEHRPQGAYRQFVSGDGWVITESETGPSDNPHKTRAVRIVIFLFLHAVHLALWFVCLWLLMRFQWGHALTAAFVLTITCAIIMLPMLVGYAMDVSRARHVPTGNAPPAVEAPK